MVQKMPMYHIWSLQMYRLHIKPICPTTDTCTDGLQVLPEIKLLRTAAIHRFRFPPTDTTSRIPSLRRPTLTREAHYSLHPR